MIIKRSPRHQPQNLFECITEDCIVKQGHLFIQQCAPLFLKRRFKAKYFVFDGHVLYRVHPSTVSTQDPSQATQASTNKPQKTRCLTNNSEEGEAKEHDDDDDSDDDDKVQNSNSSHSSNSEDEQADNPTFNNDNNRPVLLSIDQRFIIIDKSECRISSSSSSSAYTKSKSCTTMKQQQHSSHQINHSTTTNSKSCSSCSHVMNSSAADTHNNTNNNNTNNNNTSNNSNGDQHAPVVVRVMDASQMIGKEYAIGLFFKQSLSPVFLLATSTKEHKSWLRVLSTAVTKKHIEERVDNVIHQAVRSMTDMTLISDAFGEIQCVSQSLRRFFGYSHGQLTTASRNVRDLMPLEYAKHHDTYLGVYRKMGEKRLIGNPRVLPVLLKNGSMVQVVLSLGEIPNSTNMDKDRFLCIMKPYDKNDHGDSSNTSSNISNIKRNKQGEYLCPPHPSPDSPYQQYQECTENGRLSRTALWAMHLKIADMFESLSHKVTAMHQRVTHLQEKTIEWDRLETYANQAKTRMKNGEDKAKQLLSITSKQSDVCMYLQYQINCTVQNVRSKSTSDSFHNRLQERLKTIEDIFLERESHLFTPRQRLMKQIVENISIGLDAILEIEVSLRFFTIFCARSSQAERLRSILKFYLYLTRHYQTETSLDALNLKKSFIMDFFVAEGAEESLHITNRMRSFLKQQHSRVHRLSDKEEELQLEHCFFDSLFMTLRPELVNACQRFRADELYDSMRMEVAQNLLSQIKG